MPNIDDDEINVSVSKDDIDDKVYKLDAVPPKLVHEMALNQYLYKSKNGIRIPAPLQGYINRGLQRILDGEGTPFPVTKKKKHNILAIVAYIQYQSKNIGEVEAIKAAAVNFKVDAKTIRSACKDYYEDPHKHFWYYLLELTQSNTDEISVRSKFD